MSASSILGGIDKLALLRRFCATHTRNFRHRDLVHEKMGHYSEAEAAFVQTAKFNPDHQDVYFALGTLYED